MDENLKHHLKHFYLQVEELSAQMKSRSDSGVIYVYLGPANQEIVLSVNQQISDTYLLVYLYRAEDLTGDVDYAAEPPFANEFTNTIFIPIDKAELYKDKLALIVDKLNNHMVQFSAYPAWNEECRGMIFEINMMIDFTVQNRMQNKVTRLTRLRHPIFNLPSILRNHRLKLNGAQEAFPAIVCGAGPSLASQIDILKRFSDRVLIFAVGHAVRFLMAEKVPIDFIVEVDSHSIWCRDWPDEAKSIPLLTIAGGSPIIADFFDEVIWYQGVYRPMNEFIERNIGELPNVSKSRSVSVSALDLARQAGCKHIALIGNDLCLSKERAYVPGEYRSDIASKLTKVACTSGGYVESDEGFTSLRVALEHYFRANTKDNGDVRFFNCTPDGALIRFSEAMDLQEFCERFAGAAGAKNLVLGEADRRIDLPRLKEVIERYREYITCLGEIRVATEQLAFLLNQESLDMRDIGTWQDKLKMAIRRKDVLSGHQDFTGWVSPLLEFMEDGESENVDKAPAENDSQGLLRKIERDTRFLGDLCQDFLEDLEFVDRKVKASRENEKMVIQDEARDPFRFPSFRKFSLRFIEKRNPEYADALSNDYFPDTKRYILHAMHTQPPNVSIIAEDGVETFLNVVFTPEKSALAEMRDFLKDKSLKAETHAVLFLCPVNWLQIIGLSHLCPGVEIMVVDPWPELFNLIIHYSPFLRRISSETLIVGMSDKLRNWPILLKEELARWRSLRKKVVPYIPRQVREILEVIDAVRVLRDLDETLVFADMIRADGSKENGVD